MGIELTERWLTEIAGWKVIKPARALAASGAVLRAEFDGALLRGLVQDGRKRLACGLKVAGATDVTNLCACPEARATGAMCVHSIAAAFAFLNQAGERTSRGGGGETGARPAPQVAQRQQVPEDHDAPDPHARRGASVLQPVLRDSWADELKAGRLSVAFRGNDGSERLLRELRELRDVCDRAVADALERLGHDRIRDAVTVQRDRAAPLLEAVLHHPRLRVGAASPRVADASVPLRVRVTRQGDRVMLEMQSSGELVEAGGACWWWSAASTEAASGILIRLTVPAEFLGLLARRELSMPEPAFARLIEVFFEAFEASLDSDAALIASCRGVVGMPEVVLRLEGSLRALDAQLSFAYSEGPTVELGSDPQRLFPYRRADGTRMRRNEAFEVRAFGELRECGFDVGQKSLRINDEEKILRFLSHCLPGLRSRWNVLMGERFAHVAQSVLLVRPRVEWEPSGATGNGEDWLEFGMHFESGDGVRVSTGEIQRMLRVGRSKSSRPDGKTAVVDLEGVEDWNIALEEAGVRMLGDRIRVPRAQAAFVAASLRRMGAEMKPDFVRRDIGRFQITSNLQTILRDYQYEGVQWLAERGIAHGGAVLGDEMGLGKTLQALALLAGLRNARAVEEKQGKRAPFLALVVCPASLLWNWQAEITRFLQDFKIFVLHGTSRGKLFIKLKECDVAITTYALVTRDLPKWSSVELDALVLDEASFVRNPDTRAAKAVRALGRNARLRVALTGTPVENSVRDLWSVMECVVPGYLGTRVDFQERYEKPLAGGAGLSRADRIRISERLNRRIQPFFLRRTKERVAKELPAKIETVQWIEMSPLQLELYRGISREAASLVQDAGRAGGAAASRMHMLTALLRLRQVCCDPRLVSDKASGADSAKLEAVGELLERILADGHSVLVFSQFVSMLRLLREKVESAGVGYCYLDGASADRREQVEAFQGDARKRVFLISLKAGGYGLNLTKADVVIHYDPWWNPAVEAQATDRAHRIGQSRPVTIYKFIARASVEEKILRLQGRKQDVVDAALDDNQPLMRGLTEQDLLELLG